MRILAVLLVLASAIGLAVILSRQSPQRPDEIIDTKPVEPVAPSAENTYVGSARCGDCHKDIYARWRKTAHRKTVQEFAPGVSAKPFDGEVFSAREVDQQIGPGAEMHVEGPGGKKRTYPVDLVIGVRRVQMFTTKLDGGRIQVLPVFLEVPKKKWFDYADFIFGAPKDMEIPPDSQNSWYASIARNFNSSCGDCHTTNYEIGYDPETGTYDTTWLEPTIGCEACHGPGSQHTAKWSVGLGDDAPDPMVNPAKLPVERSNQICGLCHAEADLVVPGFLPGDDLFAFKDVRGLEDRKHVMVDGRANELIHNLVPIMQSRCGPISCTKCHDPHGSGIPGDVFEPLSNDWTCTQCHGEIGANVEAHTHHKASSPGSRCVGCHMPRLVIEGGHGWTHDHTISIPSIVNTDKHGTPNACRTCHMLEDIGWEEPHFKRLWPDAEKNNHRVALADTMASREEPKLRKLLENANPVYRAGAAWALASLGADLRDQLKDEHVMVRRAAIRGVGQTHPDALIPLLEDENMVLRRRAAETLARNYAFIRGRAELRERVLAVLRTFSRLRPDDSGLHGSIGYLHEMAGRKDAAVAAFERSLRVNPHNDAIRTRLERLKK